MQLLGVIGSVRTLIDWQRAKELMLLGPGVCEFFLVKSSGD